MHTADIEYFHQGTRLVGEISVDESRAGRRPAVLVAPDAGGLDDHAKRTARKLAELGYVAFALDYYGDGERLAPEQVVPGSASWPATCSGSARSPGPGSRSCWPTSTPTPARWRPSGTASVAPFPSSWPAAAPTSWRWWDSTPDWRTSRPGDAADIKAKVLVCIGADDPIVPPAQRLDFEEEMRAGGVDWQLHLYGGAVHSFTNPAADGSNPATRYDRRPTSSRGQPCSSSSGRSCRSRVEWARGELATLPEASRASSRSRSCSMAPQGGHPDPALLAQVAQRPALEGDEVPAQVQFGRGRGRTSFVGLVVVTCSPRRRSRARYWARSPSVSSSGSSAAVAGLHRGGRGPLGSAPAGLAFGVGHRGVLAEAQPADQAGQGHALADEGHDDHREAQVDDVVAAGQQRPAVVHRRYGEQRRPG